MKGPNGAAGALRTSQLKSDNRASLHVTHCVPVANPQIGIPTAMNLGTQAGFYHGRVAALGESAQPYALCDDRACGSFSESHTPELGTWN
jgi:hypothetical protein